MDPIEEKLEKLGLVLPAPPTPGGNYVPFRFNGNSLILAGVISARDGQVTHAGAVGKEQSIEAAYRAAEICALNSLAAIKAALGELSRVVEFTYLSGYVNAVPGFDASPQVINGASDLFVKLYGEAGKHARAAIGVTGLPRNATVEIQLTVKFE